MFTSIKVIVASCILFCGVYQCVVWTCSGPVVQLRIKFEPESSCGLGTETYVVGSVDPRRFRHSRSLNGMAMRVSVKR